MLFVHHFPSCRGWSAAQNSSAMKTLLAGLNLRQANLPRSVIFPRRASPPLSQHDQAGGSHFLVATQPFGIPNSSLAVPIISDGAGGRPLGRLPPSRFPRGGGVVFTSGQVFVCTTAPLPYLFQLPHKPPPASSHSFLCLLCPFIYLLGSLLCSVPQCFTSAVCDASLVGQRRSLGLLRASAPRRRNCSLAGCSSNTL